MSSSLIIRIENKNPVELLDFTKALLAIGDQFKRDMDDDASQETEAKLYVKELRPGSLVAELVPMLPPAVAALAATTQAIVDNAEVLGQYVERTRAVLDWLLAKRDQPEKAEASRVKNAMNILEPVAKDNGANISISISGNDNHAPIYINTTEANAAQNRGKAYLEGLKEPTLDIRQKALMYWAQVKNEDGPPERGEKAIIESISDRQVRVIFDSRTVRDEMLRSEKNPLNEAYIVDVEVQTVKGRIVCYKVLQLHERVSLD